MSKRRNILGGQGDTWEIENPDHVAFASKKTADGMADAVRKRGQTWKEISDILPIRALVKKVTLKSWLCSLVNIQARTPARLGKDGRRSQRLF